MKKSIVLILLTWVLIMFGGCSGGSSTPEFDKEKFIGTWVSIGNETEILEVKDNGTIKHHVEGMGKESSDTQYKWNILDNDKEYDIEYGDSPSDWNSSKIYISEDGTTMNFYEGIRGYASEYGGEIWFRKGVENIENGRDVIDFEVKDLRVKDGLLTASGIITNNGEGTYTNLTAVWTLYDEQGKELLFTNDSIYELFDKALKPNESIEFDLSLSVDDSTHEIEGYFGKTVDVEDVATCDIILNRYVKC